MSLFFPQDFPPRRLNFHSKEKFLPFSMEAPDPTNPEGGVIIETRQPVLSRMMDVFLTVCNSFSVLDFPQMRRGDRPISFRGA